MGLDEGDDVDEEFDVGRQAMRGERLERTSGVMHGLMRCSFMSLADTEQYWDPWSIDCSVHTRLQVRRLRWRLRMM